MNTKSAKKPRNFTAVAMNRRYGSTGTVYHDRRQARDKNRGQVRKKEIEWK